MKPEQQPNATDDVLADMGDSLREWAPSRDEERGALDRVWAGLRWKARQVPAEAVRSVETPACPDPSRASASSRARSRDERAAAS